MKTLALFLLFLGITATFASLSAKSLEQIQQDEFGSTLLNLIDMNMRLKTPVSDIQALLTNVLNNLLADQQLSQNNYKKQNDLLTKAIENGKALISTFEGTISVLGDSINSDLNTIQTKQKKLQTIQTALNVEIDRLNTLQNNQQQYVPNAQADIEDLKNAIAALKTAIIRMQSYQSASVDQLVLIQVSSHTKKDMETITSVLERMKSSMSKTSSIYTPVVRELLDLSEHLTQEKAQRVIDLLTKLLSLLQDTLTNLETQLSTFVSNSETQKTSANKNIDGYKVEAEQLNTDINNLKQRIQQSQLDIVGTVALRNGAQEKLAADQESLKNINDAFVVQDDRYKRLIPLIRKVIDYFNTNIAGGDSYAVNAANTA